MNKFVLILLGLFIFILMLSGCSVPESDSITDASNPEASPGSPNEAEDYVDVLDANGCQYHFIGEEYEAGKPRWFSNHSGDTMYSINIDARDCFLYSDISADSPDWEKIFLSDKGEIYMFASFFKNDYYITIYWYPTYDQNLIYFDLEYTDSDFNDYNYVASYDISSQELNELISEHKEFDNALSEDTIIQIIENFYRNINNQLSAIGLSVDDLLEATVK